MKRNASCESETSRSMEGQCLYRPFALLLFILQYWLPFHHYLSKRPGHLITDPLQWTLWLLTWFVRVPGWTDARVMSNFRNRSKTVGSSPNRLKPPHAAPKSRTPLTFRKWVRVSLCFLFSICLYIFSLNISLSFCDDEQSSTCSIHLTIPRYRNLNRGQFSGIIKGNSL